MTGGIVDDTVITRLAPKILYMVTNAACRDKDMEYLKEHIQDLKSEGYGPIEWNVLDGWGLIALQGPLSSSILSQVLVGDREETNLDTLYFGQSRFLSLRMPSGRMSPPLLVSRGGYTGEDGFEISIPAPITPAITQSLLQSAGPDQLRLAGLGARDSLRLEAGMCLYGHDLDDSTTPVDAGLSWIVGKDRRTEGGFFGDAVILRQLAHLKEGGEYITRRRVGLVVDKAPAREGAEIVNLGAEGIQKGAQEPEMVGKITSGCPSPTLGKNIAMGYVKNGLHKVGTKLGVRIRGKVREATVTKMPFVPTRYSKPATAPT